MDTPPPREIRQDMHHPCPLIPQVALEGGEWVLRVEDVSGASATEEPLAPAASEEERAAFPPLPGETIILEQA